MMVFTICLQAYKLAKGQVWSLVTLLCFFSAIVSAFLVSAQLCTPVLHVLVCDCLQYGAASHRRLGGGLEQRLDLRSICCFSTAMNKLGTRWTFKTTLIYDLVNVFCT